MAWPGCLSDLWEKLKESKTCKSLLKKHLTPERFQRLKDRTTKLGGTLAHCIVSGCQNLDSGVGIYACDPEAYDVFGDVFNAVIMDYHKVDKINHPKPDFGDIENLDFGDLDPKGEFIISTRVRVGRSHAGFPFPPAASREQILEMECKSKKALSTLTGQLAGKYYPLDGMTPADQTQLIDDHFLFKDNDRFLRDAGGYRFWNKGRGIYHNKDKTFLTWVNEEDHLRFISMQKGGDLGQVYKRLVTAVNKLEEQLDFAKKDGLGYLTFCPTNLGTTLRASVHIRIPLLSKQNNFNSFCENLNLQPRGIHGEHTESVGGVYDVSNKRRLGLTEFEAVQEMQKGVEAIIKKEKDLRKAVPRKG